MNRLDLEAINNRSPYDVHSVGDQYVFVTDTGIEYHVDFELDSNPYYTAYWFNGYEQQQRYLIRSVEVKGDDKRKDYVALIIQRTNPRLDEIVARFDSEIAMFNDFKP